MKRYFVHNAVFRIVAPPIYGILVYLLILLINNDVARINDTFVNQEVYVCIALCYLSLESLRLMIVMLGRYSHKRSSELPIVFQVLITSLTSIALVLVALSLYFNQILGFSIAYSQLQLFGVVYFITALLYNALYFSNYYLHKENAIKLQVEQQQRNVLEMEIDEFKNDINPDLLYESLENLIALMYRDVEQAEEYIDSLASAYRYVLSNRQQELVPLSMEVTAAKNMVRLLNERYNGLLQFESSLTSDELKSMVIPGSLPVIIEHVVRNTIITRHEPFVIQCYREEDYITIQARLNDRLISHGATDIAFSRLQKSYTVYSDLPLIKVKAYQENYVKLPLIRMAEELTTQ